MTRKKIELYILSLWLLFFFVIILKIDIPFCWGSNCTFIGIDVLFKKNIAPFFALLFLIYGIYAFLRFDNDLKGTTNIPFRITKIESLNFEHLTFLATYLIPLISFDFDDARYMIILTILLIVMGVIYIKTDLFYANPTLSLLNFHIYKVNGSFKGEEERNDIILISRTELDAEQRVSYLKLDKRVYYVKALHNE